jgi:hypothetical protein
MDNDDNYCLVLAKCQAGMLPQGGQNDKDFCMLHFLEVERRDYLLNHDELEDETFAGSLFISISEAYQVWGIIFRYWRNAKPACYRKDKMTSIFACFIFWRWSDAIIF